jgi:opacity protein-like surface antigen
VRAVLHHFDTGSRAVSYLLGGMAVALAVAALFTSASAAEITSWAHEVLGWSFVALLGSLVFVALFAWSRMISDDADDGDVWPEIGIQAANGVMTLALTYTLLGISLGIGSLAGQDLTPDTVQTVIRKMTANFSLAFMTTVVGLPVSAALRSLLIVTLARNRNRLPAPHAAPGAERS